MRAGVVVIGMVAVRVCKMAVGCAQLLRLFIHQVCENNLAFTEGHVLVILRLFRNCCRNHICRVIAGGNNQTADGIFYCQRFAQLMPRLAGIQRNLIDFRTNHN